MKIKAQIHLQSLDNIKVMLQTQASKLEHPTHEKQAAAKKIPNKCEKKPAITA